MKQDQDRRLYIDFQCLRYCWSDSNRRFVRAKVNVGNSLGDIKRSVREIEYFSRLSLFSILLVI